MPSLDSAYTYIWTLADVFSPESELKLACLQRCVHASRATRRSQGSSAMLRKVYSFQELGPHEDKSWAVLACFAQRPLPCAISSRNEWEDQVVPKSCVNVSLRFRSNINRAHIQFIGLNINLTRRVLRCDPFLAQCCYTAYVHLFAAQATATLPSNV